MAWSEALRTRLWPLPVMGVTLALVVGIGLPELEQKVDSRLPPWLSAYLFGGMRAPRAPFWTPSPAP